MKLQLICFSLLGALPSAIAQQAPLPIMQQPTASAPQRTISSYMGLHTFPEGNQTPAQQQQDEMACYQWAKQDSSFDPLAALTARQQQPGRAGSGQPATAEGRGAAIKGAVEGAAVGAATGTVVGAIEGNPAKGAAAGAAGGGLLGLAMTKRAQRAEQRQAQQQQRQQAQEQAQ